MKRRRATHGFTLVELLVSLVVTLVVVTGAILAMQSQQRAYHSGQRLREAQDAGRRAALAIEQTLRHAGLGVDPALALDFSYYGLSQPLDGSLCPQTTMGDCRRDAIDNSDEIVFYARDPAFQVTDAAGNLSQNPVGSAWRIVDVNSESVQLQANAGETFPAGQILVAICPDPNAYAYFTVASRRDAAPGGTPTTIPLQPVNLLDPFHRQDVADLSASNPNRKECFRSGYVYKVDRYRFHVRPVAMPTGGFEPYLVLDMGVDRPPYDDAVTEADELLVASGVELVQFSYLFQGGMTAGATPGTAIRFPDASPSPGPGIPPTFGDGSQDVITRTVFPLDLPTLERSIYFPSSWFPVSQTSPNRNVNAQGNVRAVRVGIVSRSRSPDPLGHANIIIGPGFTLGNFQGSSSAPAWLTAGRPADGDDRYVRSRLEITIPVPNMRIRAMSLN